MAFDFLTLQDFVNADILLSSLNGILLGDRWFAISYVYSNGEICWVSDISKSLQSKSSYKRYRQLFGNKTEAELSDLVKKDSVYSGRYGYDNCFERIPMISDVAINGNELFENE